MNTVINLAQNCRCVRDYELWFRVIGRYHHPHVEERRELEQSHILKFLLAIIRMEILMEIKNTIVSDGIDDLLVPLQVRCPLTIFQEKVQWWVFGHLFHLIRLYFRFPYPFPSGHLQRNSFSVSLWTTVQNHPSPEKYCRKTCFKNKPEG